MPLINKPYAESCDQNKEPILSVIGPLLAEKRHLLEIGSGTGQHAVYFAEKIPQLRWQCSDREDSLDGIRCWLRQAARDNLPEPLVLDVADSRWPTLTVDALFTANTVHIMHRHEVVRLMQGGAGVLRTGGDMLIYGPFNYNGAFTSASNEQFDQWLKSRDPQSGIKDVEFLLDLAQQNALHLVKDYAMPANNRILHFIKHS